MERIGLSAGRAWSVEEVGDVLAEQMASLVPFDRLSLRTVDMDQGTFIDVYVSGLDVPARRQGDVRALGGTVVEEAMSSRATVLVADESSEESLRRFPGMRPAIDAGIRSLIGAPLVSNDLTVAALMVASVPPQAYSEHHRELARQIGEQVGDAVARCIRALTMQRDASENATLAEIGQFAGSSLDLTRACEQAAGRLRILIPYDRLEIAVLDAESGTGTDVFVSGDESSGWGAGRTFDISGSPIEEVSHSKSSILSGPSQGLAAPTGYGSAMTLPMISDNRVVATLTFRSAELGVYSHRLLTLAEHATSQLVAAVAGSAEIARLRDRLVEATRKEDTISEIAALNSSSAELDQGFEGVAEQARQLVPFDLMVVADVDPDTRRATCIFVSGTQVPDWGTGATFGMGSDQYAALAGEGAGFTAATGTSEEPAAGLPEWPFLAAAGIRSALAAPMKSRGLVEAALILGSKADNIYSQSDLELANRIASSMSGAVADSKAYAARQAAEAAQRAAEAATEEAEQRKREKERALSEIARSLASSPALDDALGSVAEHIRKLIPYSRLSIATVDEKNGSLRFLYDRAESMEVDGEEPSDSRLAGILEDTMRQGTPRLVRGRPSEDGEQSPAAPSTSKTPETPSVVAVPLVSQGEPIGALALTSRSPDEPYTDIELTLAERVGLQIAAAVAGHHLKGMQERESKEAEILTAIGRVIAQSEELEEVYRRFDELLRTVLIADRIEIVTIDTQNETATLVYWSGTELGRGEIGQTEPLAGSVFEEPALRRSAVLVGDDPSLELATRFPTATAELQAGIRSVVVAPLLVQGDVVGAISVASTEPDAYDQLDVTLAERAGFQVASVLEKAATPETPPPDPEEWNALAELGRIADSSLDIDEVFGILSERIQTLLPFDRMAIWTVDLQQENLVAAYATGSGESEFEPGKSFPLKGLGAQGSLPDRAGVEAREDSSGALAQRLLEALGRGSPGMPAALLVPMVVGQEQVGMLSLRAPAPHTYSGREVAVAERVAAQIAGPVANAQVFRECQQVEGAVKKAVDRLDQAIWGSDEGLWDWDFLKNEIWYSPRFRQLVGLDEGAEADLRQWNERIHPDDRLRVHQAQNDHLEHTEPYDVDYRLRTGTGEYRWFNERGKAVWDDSEKAIRFSGSLRDIQDAREAEAGPPELRPTLEIVDRLRLAILQRREMEVESAQIEYLANLDSAVRRVTQLAGDLRTMTDVMKTTVCPEPVNLSNIARSVVSGLRKGHPRRKVRFSCAGDIGVEGDPQAAADSY